MGHLSFATNEMPTYRRPVPQETGRPLPQVDRNEVRSEAGTIQEGLQSLLPPRLPHPLFSEEQPELVDEKLAEGMPEEVALEDGDSSTSE